MPVFDKARHVMYTPSNGVYVGFGAISEFNRFKIMVDLLILQLQDSKLW